MGRGYSTEEIREKLISTLRILNLECQKVEISDKIGINRITMTKYLKVFVLKVCCVKKILKHHIMVFRTWTRGIQFSR